MRLLKHLLFPTLMLSIFSNAISTETNNTEINKTEVHIQTNLGEIVIALDIDKAPITVKNFIRYIEDDFYKGTIFHRVVDDFVIQGGGFTAGMKKKKISHKPIINEADNGLRNYIGTIAMARTNHPNSATSQFFINLKNNYSLDYTSKNPGYCVFGNVTEGMDVVRNISKVLTTSLNNHKNVPEQSVIIESIALTTPSIGFKQRIKNYLQKTLKKWFS